tara:strand:+ start:285 stop:1010 length:726 start_codon:yes stop_codon:yes gene_type:complete
MGTEDQVNEAGDAMDIEPVLDDHINQILRETQSLDYSPSDLPAPLLASVQQDLLLAVSCFLRHAPSKFGAWGWKNPRCMFILPLINEMFDGLRFVHLVRDGRDMATSENQNQPRKHFEAMFNEPLDPRDPSGAMRLWAKANLGTANWGERILGERYMRIRFEDLCATPRKGTAQILEFALISQEDRAKAVSMAENLVATPKSINRWHTLEPETAKNLTRLGQEALRRFGYSDDVGAKTPIA